ncbi:hypothetical protein BDA96_10G193400 [Sorghum bicolor]|uniref:MADS-box domain-containing protein n=2 Tax=Sorghum bicolor TaxID=4558 RepID=A0A921Q550_SORBI|nr:agamous-like MADS-box protein AGL61 [Sorghum bicolor]EER89814.1 hypothetical protein SORBI_3010G148400 [Sorghum bicolor]KAG0514460.1 hypothetical protein BDA96_10G193400 [Sorghum bicolor]|eukprot:XP_002438447.1 agamous-like MADS-box protein AGL61 [Sorghum bicolor]
MVRELRRIDNEEQRRSCFRKRRPTLFTMARDISEEFGAHVAVVAFSPTGEAHAFGGPTVDSVLRTHLPADGASSHPPFPSLDAAAETAGEATARVAGLRRDGEETKALVAKEWARVAATREKVKTAQATAQKKNWWEVDAEALGEEELPVFIRALELLKSDVKGRVDVVTSSRLNLPCREKKQQ